MEIYIYDNNKKETFLLGEIIKQYRINNGLSQSDLGKRLQVSKNTVYAWENHLLFPDLLHSIMLSEYGVFNLNHLEYR